MNEFTQIDLQIGTEEQFETKKANLSEGVIVGLTDPIHENELDSALQTKIIGKLTAPTTPTANSVVIMEANGTTGTKALSEFGGKLYEHKVFGNLNEAPLSIYVSIINDIGTNMTNSEINQSITNFTKCLVNGSIGASNVSGVGYINKGSEEGAYYLNAVCVNITDNTFYGITNMSIMVGWSNSSITEL